VIADLAAARVQSTAGWFSLPLSQHLRAAASIHTHAKALAPLGADEAVRVA